jgi:hypothetical protein
MLLLKALDVQVWHLKSSKALMQGFGKCSSTSLSTDAHTKANSFHSMCDIKTGNGVILKPK